jgi:integrase
MADRLTLNDALRDYYTQRKGRYSASTWHAHEGQLERWRTWITRETQPNVYLDDIDERHMVRYFDKLRPPAVAPSSFNNYRQYLRSFWLYCREEAWVQTNPMRHVDAMRVPKRVRLQLSADELLALLDGAGPRDRVALAVGMNTGLRGGDIAALTVGSVNLGNDTLLAWEEKTDQETLLPITADLRPELLRWFQHYAEACDIPDWRKLPNHWTLIPPARGAALNVHDPSAGFRVAYKTTARYRHPETIVHRALERIGHDTHREGFHTLRRSAARELYNLAVRDGIGDPIRIAQALLNHKSQKTTEIYLGITHEKELRDGMMRGKAFLSRSVTSADVPVIESKENRSA